MIQKIEHSLSYKTILAIILLIVGSYLIFKLADVIFLVIVAYMLTSALHPLVKRLNTKLPLSLSVAIVIIGILFPLIAVLALGIPSLIEQGPAILNKINEAIYSTKFIPESIRSNINLSQYAEELGGYLLQSASTVTTLVTLIFSLIFLTIYLLLDRLYLRKILLALIPKDHRKQTQELMTEFERVSGQYIRGNLIISAICSVFIFIGLTLLHVPGAPLLAVFAGMMDLLPLVGSIIGALPAIVLAFSISPTAGILVLALFAVYQQIENHLLAPNIYNKALNLSPVVSFLAVIVGTVLYGIPGAFIALPLAATIPALVEFIQKYEKDSI